MQWRPAVPYTGTNLGPSGWTTITVHVTAFIGRPDSGVVVQLYRDSVDSPEFFGGKQTMANGTATFRMTVNTKESGYQTGQTTGARGWSSVFTFAWDQSFQPQNYIKTGITATSNRPPHEL